jgi:hypothetical protein
MKNFILLFASVMLLMSCEENKDEQDKDKYSLCFLPRKVSHLFVLSGQQLGTYDLNIYKNLKMSRDQFGISVLTSNFDILDAYSLSLQFENSDKNANIQSIEEQIRQDYFQKYPMETSMTPNIRFVSKKGQVQEFVDIEYRTSVVRNLTISALATPLFGKQAGEPLNDFFNMAIVNPPLIVSSLTNTLVYGYSDSSYPTSIKEWLDLSPLAQANIYLVPNTEISEVPVQVQFVVQMETAEGVILSDTTRMITITE